MFQCSDNLKFQQNKNLKKKLLYANTTETQISVRIKTFHLYYLQRLILYFIVNGFARSYILLSIVLLDPDGTRRRQHNNLQYCCRLYTGISIQTDFRKQRFKPVKERKKPYTKVGQLKITSKSNNIMTSTTHILYYYHRRTLRKNRMKR